MIGAGPMVGQIQSARPVKRELAELEDAFDRMKDDILSGGQADLQNVSIEVKLSRKLYYFIGNRSWGTLARKNGLAKRDLYKKPYRE